MARVVADWTGSGTAVTDPQPSMENEGRWLREKSAGGAGIRRDFQPTVFPFCPSSGAGRSLVQGCRKSDPFSPQAWRGDDGARWRQNVANAINEL